MSLNQSEPTPQLDLPRSPGRKPKFKSGAMSASERKAAERAKRKARGEAQVWLTPEEIRLVEQFRSGSLYASDHRSQSLVDLEDANQALSLKLNLTRNQVSIVRALCTCGAFHDAWPPGSNLIDAMYRDRVNSMDWDS